MPTPTGRGNHARLVPRHPRWQNVRIMPVVEQHTSLRTRAHAKRVATVMAIGLAAMVGAACAGKGADVDAHQVFSDAKVADLVAAAVAGHAAQVRAAIAAGADVNAHGDKGVTPLEWAMLNRSPEAFRALLDAGANPDEPAVGGDPVILMAAKANDPAYLKMLLAHHVDPSVARGRSDQTPLMAAILNANTDTPFKLLLAAGANPNVTNRLGDAALHIAATGGSYAQVLALLEAGANPRARNQRGDTFQSLLRLTPPERLSPAAKQQLAAIDAWLRAHAIPVEAPDRI